MKEFTDNVMERKIIITGATSFIGSHMTALLLKEGCSVWAVVRPNSTNLHRLELDKALHVVELDLHELDRLPHLLPEGGFYGWFHGGWEGAGSENRKKPEVQQKNVESSLRALEAARQMGCSRFLFTGSQAEYGIYHKTMTEDLECRPVSEYGKAKAEVCRRALHECRQWGFGPDYIHARIFSVYGPGDRAETLVGSCLRSCLEDRELKLGPCTQLWNYLHVEDLTGALYALMFHPDVSSGVYNVANRKSDTRPLREYVQEIQRICKGKGKLSFGPRPPHAEGEANLIPDIKKLCQTTGWEPCIRFEDGIGGMVSAYADTLKK